jgi:hypothetical protein
MTIDPAIVFLDDNEDLREVMPVLLETSLGVVCRCFSSVMELQNHSREVLGAKVAILDINLGPNAPDGVDAFDWLAEHGFRERFCSSPGMPAPTHEWLALEKTESKSSKSLFIPTNFFHFSGAPSA